MAKTLSVKKQTTALAGWEQRLAQEAKDDAAREITQGRFISVKGMRFHYNGKELQHPLNVVVMDSIYENARYEGDYDPDKPRAPICFAFSRDGKDMRPHELAAKPQSPTCATCHWFKFGTADKGKGKGCKNTRRMALMMPGSMKDIPNAEIVYYRPPVTSVKNWSKYVNGLDSVLKRPAWSVVTALEIKPDGKNQFEVLFHNPQPLDLKDDYDAMQAKRTALKEEIEFPYQAQAEEEPVEQKPKRPVKYK